MDSMTKVYPSLKWLWALRDTADVRPKDKDLGRLLMSYANDRGEMRPTVDQLRRQTMKDDEVTCVSASTIKRRRQRLIEAGWLKLVLSGGRGRGSNYASTYRLSFPDGLIPEDKPKPDCDDVPF